MLNKIQVFFSDLLGGKDFPEVEENMLGFFYGCLKLNTY